MKTRIYIDGYNLYYGRLKGTPYKWLDLDVLFSKFLLPSSSPHSQINEIDGIKFFTADIIGRAARDPNSIKDQQSYHRALKFHLREKFSLIKGYYSLLPISAHQVESGRDIPQSAITRVWKLEEKQTDVNIAVEALADAILDDDTEQVVFVTNDTDIAPVLAKIRTLSSVKVGLVIPTPKGVRHPNVDLCRHAHWVRHHILDDELSRSQLPRVVSGGRKPAIKPESWFGQVEILSEILQSLKQWSKKIERNVGNGWKVKNLKYRIYLFYLNHQLNY
ncbi:NYN domain-containing protein [Psychrosphaera algicola]|uniref:NYN domain-containing protein n=1 Tax=Psychrosphaera algicola TaxID=3023714 RepID=A0ABT5FFC1_9GAMM|nr:NYN domain-containing protein [Psychrosphaera sp. G1-22]MDC2889325.1 NYN domain-containing protein [Psychrosphaera sp. G1-22]